MVLFYPSWEEGHKFREGLEFFHKVMTLNKLFQKEIFLIKNESVEYINLYLITALAALLYALHGAAFLLCAYNPVLIVTQALSVCVCAAAFFINRRQGPRTASIIMIFLICATINIWAYMVDGGNDMRWYAILALCPLYFFSVLKKRDKIVFTVLIMASFLSSTIIVYWHEPVIKMSNAELYNTATGIVIFMSIALELILYKYVNDKRDSELKRVGTILDNIECGIAIVDAETHKILDINPVAERMYEGRKDTIMGEKCHELICPAEEGACPVTDKFQEVHRSERVLIKANGEMIPIIKSVAKIRYNDRPALLESFTDITDLKEAEEKVRLLKITEQANRAKSDFLSRMSHEMRTPMNAIIGMTKIAEGTDDINRLKYCLSMIDISSSHLLSIINDILDMSKIESGKFELDNAPLRIEKILAKISGIMLEQAEKKNVDLSIFAGSGTDVQYVGDELRLTQVITNLLSNAVKFTPAGGKVKLSVSEEQKEAGFSILRFAISDTGIGMTKEQLGKLFNAFEQADGSITRKYGGTGLGLAISKSIVEKMGGSIWAESILGEGSLFTFDVKLEHAGTQEEISDISGRTPPVFEEAPAGPKGMPDFSGITILLAEDVEINREIFIALLEGTNIKIDTAENGLEAVQKFKENPDRYAAIIMDIQMPVMNGYEATKTIRSLDMDKAKNIPIIALTADAFKEDVDRCIACGMNNHLKKPIEMEKVIEMLSRYSYDK